MAHVTTSLAGLGCHFLADRGRAIKREGMNDKGGHERGLTQNNGLDLSLQCGCLSGARPGLEPATIWIASPMSNQQRHATTPSVHILRRLYSGVFLILCAESARHQKKRQMSLYHNCIDVDCCFSFGVCSELLKAVQTIWWCHTGRSQSLYRVAQKSEYYVLFILNHVSTSRTFRGCTKFQIRSALYSRQKDLLLDINSVSNERLKVKGQDTCCSAVYMSQAQEQQRFTFFYNIWSGSWLAWANDTAVH